MRLSSLVAATILTALPVTPSGAQASTLADHNARIIAAASPSTTAISSRTGARTRRSVPASYGRNADINFRGMVKLATKFEVGEDRMMTEHCGGTVIDARWIVTAAHCVSPDDGARWNRIEITTGDPDLDSAHTITRLAHTAIIHSDFEYATLTNDIALIHLREPLPRTIVPASLDRAARPSLTEGQTARAAGWPITGAKAGTRHLQTTDLIVAKSTLPGFITVSSPSGQAEGVCQGESGGPLMASTPGGPQLAGILSGIQPGTQNSAGEPCMLGGYQMYFTPIATYRKWIDRVRAVCSVNPRMCSPTARMRVAVKF